MNPALPNGLKEFPAASLRLLVPPLNVRKYPDMASKWMRLFRTQRDVSHFRQQHGIRQVIIPVVFACALQTNFWQKAEYSAIQLIHTSTTWDSWLRLSTGVVVGLAQAFLILLRRKLVCLFRRGQFMRADSWFF